MLITSIITVEAIRACVGGQHLTKIVHSIRLKHEFVISLLSLFTQEGLVTVSHDGRSTIYTATAKGKRLVKIYDSLIKKNAESNLGAYR
jgi:predicted transcriptional regulator